MCVRVSGCERVCERVCVRGGGEGGGPDPEDSNRKGLIRKGILHNLWREKTVVKGVRIGVVSDCGWRCCCCVGFVLKFFRVILEK